MKKIIVASKNPVKISATKMAFEKMFPDQEFEIEGVSVSSGVSDQPMNSEETKQGAINRANNAEKAFPDADFWIGIEGGVEDEGEAMSCFAWIAVTSPTQTGFAQSGTFYQPKKVAELVRAGKELGDADDIVFNDNNSKQKYGSVGILTNKIIDRETFYVDAVVLALIPFVHPDLY